MAGKPGRSGPKQGNKNALKNGSRIDRKRLTVGELPTKMIAVKREGRAYRRMLEEAVLDCKGEISVADSHRIDSAAAATIQAGICRWLLRHRFEEMSVTEIRNCTNDILKAKQARDAEVEALGLDEAATDDVFSALYGDLEDK